MESKKLTNIASDLHLERFFDITVTDLRVVS